MKIVCATNMPYVEEAFSRLGEPVVLEGRHIGPQDVRDAGLMAIRSTTKVDARLLDGSAVRFVGTATIGTDHMDIPYLEKRGIRWCYSPGCNANSVSEYVVAALLCLARRHGFRLEGMTMGIVGVGNVGSRVAQKARALGLKVLLNDPPKARETGDPAFVPMERIAAESDIVTFHVPLTKAGSDRTLHMADAEWFGALKRCRVLINAARGPVVDRAALAAALAAGRPAHVVLDTWEGEPGFDASLLDRVDIGSPHIAGHSFEGKVGGTVMVYRAAAEFLGKVPDWSAEPLLPPPPVPLVEIEAAGRDDEDVLHEAVRQVYDILADDARMRGIDRSDPRKQAAEFDRQRSDYPMRREFRYTRVVIKGASVALAAKFAGLGFALDGGPGRPKAP